MLPLARVLRIAVDHRVKVLSIGVARDALGCLNLGRMAYNRFLWPMCHHFPLRLLLRLLHFRFRLFGGLLRLLRDSFVLPFVAFREVGDRQLVGKDGIGCDLITNLDQS